MKSGGASRSLLVAVVTGALLTLVPGATGRAASSTFATECDSTGEAGTPFVRGVNCRTVDVDGYPREYIVYVPHSRAFDPAKETAVVFHFHGTGGRAEGTLTESQWMEKAEKARFVAVFGSGLEYFECSAPFQCATGEFKTKWHSLTLECGVVVRCGPGDRQSGYPADAPWPAADVQFTDKMLLDAQVGLVVDPRRVYLSGFSNGAEMALRLAVQRSQVFAAAGAAGPGRLNGAHSPVRHMPVYYAMGNLDGHFIDDINMTDAPEPPINQIPLTNDAAFAYSALSSRIDDLTATFGVPNTPDHVWEFSDELRLRYRSPVPEVMGGNEVLVSFQAGVTHEFANADENPEAFHDPDLFWKFFHDHPLSN